MALARTRPLLSDVVRSELKRAIIEGEFPPTSKLPNEETLCTRYNVSRITLREAVRGLIEDGYVIRRQGAGTFVTAGPALRNSLDTNFSYTEYLESTGIRTSKKILGARLCGRGGPQRHRCQAQAPVRRRPRHRRRHGATPELSCWPGYLSIPGIRCS